MNWILLHLACHSYVSVLVAIVIHFLTGKDSTYKWIINHIRDIPIERYFHLPFRQMVLWRVRFQQYPDLTMWFFCPLAMSWRLLFSIDQGDSWNPALHCFWPEIRELTWLFGALIWDISNQEQSQNIRQAKSTRFIKHSACLT